MRLHKIQQKMEKGIGEMKIEKKSRKISLNRAKVGWIRERK
jgi:hypothetical protein